MPTSRASTLCTAWAISVFACGGPTGAAAQSSASSSGGSGGASTSDTGASAGGGGAEGGAGGGGGLGGASQVTASSAISATSSATASSSTGSGGDQPYVPPPVAVQIPAAVSTDLRCNIPFSKPLTSTVKAGAIGGAVTSVVGIDAETAGIGATFELKNNASPHYVNVLETRSGAGAAWQTSSLVWDNPGGVGIMVFNQSAGNSVGSQWAYTTKAVAKGAHDIETALFTPVYSDHIHEKPEGHSPCNNSGFLFDEMKQDIFGHKVPTPHGSAILWQNVVTYRSRVNQSWPRWTAEQAFYLSRSIARAGDLRVYLVRGKTVDGPIRPYKAGFTIPGATCLGGAGTFCNTLAYDFGVLVWNIHGLDVGVAIEPLSNGVSLNLEESVYCAKPADDSCGNINFHAWFPRTEPAKFAAGAVRTMHKNYFVGTLEQLAALGFSLSP